MPPESKYQPASLRRETMTSSGRENPFLRERLADRIYALDRALGRRHVDRVGIWLGGVSADCLVGFRNTKADDFGGPCSGCLQRSVRVHGRNRCEERNPGRENTAQTDRQHDTPIPYTMTESYRRWRRLLHERGCRYGLHTFHLFGRFCGHGSKDVAAYERRDGAIRLGLSTRFSGEPFVTASSSSAISEEDMG